MVAKLLIIANVLGVIAFSRASLGPFITPCLHSDSECAKANAVIAIPLFGAGLPELGVEQMDPLKFVIIDVVSSSLKFTMKNVTLTGMKNCKPNKVERDISKHNIIIELECDVNVDADYEMDGNILITNIKGHGKMHAYFNKLVIIVEVETIDTVGDDGKKHWSVKSWKHNFELKGSSDVKFENLLPNNEFLRITSESNGNDVITNTARALIKDVVTEIGKNVHNLFAALPVIDLALD